MTVNFVSKLEEVKRNKSDCDESLIPTEERFRIFKRISIGEYILSIQASYGHYSEPRVTVDKDNYTKWEIAIFKNEGWVENPEIEFENFHRINELKEKYGEDTVGSFVPTDLIEDLLEYVKEESDE